MSTTATPSETPSSASGSARARQGFCHGPHTRDTDVLQFTQMAQILNLCLHLEAS
jgi:hypothetical protein